MTDLSMEVIIPVRNMAEHIAKCLPLLIDQCGDGDVITVVDDASSDRTGEVARTLGVRVLPLSESLGPYRARQLAANNSQADVLLFIDARYRPLPGLLDSHRDAQSRPGVMLSCTNTYTLSGKSLAARVAARQQPFSLDQLVGVDGRADFYPTANLGVKRSAFEQVGGFRAMRSGGDADLCWRIQDAFPYSFAADARVLMEWEPRSSLVGLASQVFRYGKSYAYLQWVFGEADTPRIVSKKTWRQRVRRRKDQSTASLVLEAGASFAISRLDVVGYWWAKRQRNNFEPPRYYHSLSD